MPMLPFNQILLQLASCAFVASYALQINYFVKHRTSSWNPSQYHHHYRHAHQSQRIYRSSTSLHSTTDEEMTDEALLAEVDISTLQKLCIQYSLSESGTKTELLARLRNFANDQAEQDRNRREGRKERVENNLEGKARHTFLDEPWNEEEDEEAGFFYFDAGETEAEKKARELKEKEMKQKRLIQSKPVTAPNPEGIEPNEKGERVVSIYSTTDNNDLTGMQAPSMSMDEMGGKPFSSDMPEDSLIGGPFGDMSGSKRKKENNEQLEKAKDSLRQLVGDLLATTGAPAFQDDYEEDDDESEKEANPFATPYGFVGFQSERIPPETLVDRSHDILLQNGKALHEVLEEYELQAIGYDGMAADDREKGGGHYQEVEKVRSFLNGFRKSEERRISRETSTMLLDRLVKEGVAGLDQMLSSMPKEGDDTSHMLGSGGMEAGVLNSALVRYLDEAIREQEQRVERIQTRQKDAHLDEGGSLGEEDNNLTWNITRGEDGTTIETVDLNDPVLRNELAKAQAKSNQNEGNDLSVLTVQEKMLLLLNLLRERVKVEAIMGGNAQAKNLKVLAYCLKAGSVDERKKFILEQLGSSLDALDVFSDLVISSIEYSEARSDSNDDFMPGKSQKVMSPLLNLSKLRGIKELVNEIRSTQQWKAAGVGGQAQKAPIDVKDLTDLNIEDFM
ncbi:hypothetical protein ACHAXN_010180 [Cyclotella atomus]